MRKLWSKCPFCDALKDKIGAILVVDQPIARAYRCGSYVYVTDGIEIYQKSCANG